jgi:hypothetical protein
VQEPLFSQELRKGLCSHLIVIKPSGDKFTYAKTWGKIEIVTPEWFWESLERKGTLSHASNEWITRSSSQAVYAFCARACRLTTSQHCCTHVALQEPGVSETNGGEGGGCLLCTECLDEEKYRVKEYKSVFFKDKPAPATTSLRERDHAKANGKSSSPKLGSGGSQGGPTTEAAQGQQLQRRDNGTSSCEVGLVEATRQSGGSRGAPEAAEVPWDSLFLSSCAVHLLGFAPMAKCVVQTLPTLSPVYAFIASANQGWRRFVQADLHHADGVDAGGWGWSGGA